MNNDENLELLDLDDDTSMDDALPDVPAFVTPRPKKPWLLLTVGIVIVVLATYVIIRTIGDDSSSAIEVDLDAPAIVVEAETQGQKFAVPGGQIVVPPAPVHINVPPAPQPQQPVQRAPVPQPQVQAPRSAPVVVPRVQPAAQPASIGTPVRVIEDRKEVKFEPSKPVVTKKATTAKPASKPAPKKMTVKSQVSGAANWYVQFGSYSTRAAAEAAQRKITAEHRSLLGDRQFVILAAVLKDGKTTYRLRVPFTTADDANGFCRNAKSDGLDCYVAK